MSNKNNFYIFLQKIIQSNFFRKMGNKIILGAIFLGLSLLILLGLGGKWSFPDQSWPLGKGEKVKISTEIIQKFTADRDGLARLKILFGASNIKPGGTLNLKIYNDNCQDIVRETALNITSLNADNTTDFTFAKIKDSKDKLFCLKLNYSPKNGGKKAQLFIIENSMPQNKFLSVNGQEMAGKSLAMRPCYQNASRWQDMQELNQRISQYKPWFLKHYYLYALVFGFLLLSLILVISLITL